MKNKRILIIAVSVLAAIILLVAIVYGINMKLLKTQNNGENEKNSQETVQETVQETTEGIDESMAAALAQNKIQQLSTNVFKGEMNANPILSNIFCADPTAVEYEGRLYVYGTYDQQQYEAVGADGSNTYEHIKSIMIASTEDMVNWTYHGIINVEEVAPWIYASWAPSITSRVEADGLTHFYLYFSNSGAGVGVITATNPLGPWTDPLGKSLIDHSTEGLGECEAPFDPGVCIDEEGIGWLSFGGGDANKEGTDYMPGNARIVRLGEDMLSLDSDIVVIPAPYHFEANELNYINGTYVYTYNTSWKQRSVWENKDYVMPSSCSMAYMVSTDPLNSESWEYRGHYFLNPGESGMNYSNNHTHYMEYKGQYYLLYHAMILQEYYGTEGGFRSLCVNKLNMDDSTVTIKMSGATRKGVEQIEPMDAFRTIAGATAFTSADTSYETLEAPGQMAVKSLEAGAFTYIKGIDFSQGANAVTMNVKGKGRIEIRIDDKASDPVLALEVDSKDEYTSMSTQLCITEKGVHDIFIVYGDSDLCLEALQFIQQ